MPQPSLAGRRSWSDPRARCRVDDASRPPAGRARSYGRLFASPFADHYVSAFGNWLILAGLALYYLLQWAMARATGVSVKVYTLGDPSSRASGTALLVTGVAAIVAEFVPLGHGLPTAAAVTAVPAAAVWAAWLPSRLKGVRRDLRNGAGAL
ncbi:MAG TPA: hypothetical protein VFO01_08795 [Trebonia sp.]|nr:hypothetical protein [Trebonia sp.]